MVNPGQGGTKKVHPSVHHPSTLVHRWVLVDSGPCALFTCWAYSGYLESYGNLQLSDFRIKPSPPSLRSLQIWSWCSKNPRSPVPWIPQDFVLEFKNFKNPPTPSYISCLSRTFFGLGSWRISRNPFNNISCRLKFGLGSSTILRSLQLHLLSLKVWSWKVSGIRYSQPTSRGYNQFLDHKQLRWYPSYVTVSCGQQVEVAENKNMGEITHRLIKTNGITIHIAEQGSGMWFWHS